MCYKVITFLFLISCLLQLTVKAQPIHEYMDLQIHTTMHVPYPFFSKGLKYFNEKRPPALSYKHQFKNVNYANFLQANKGARIIANGALNSEYISNPKKAKKAF